MFKCNRKIVFVESVLFLMISFVSIRSLFGSGIFIGHNWDFPFSPLPISYDIWLQKFLFVWDDACLGFSNLSAASTKIWWVGNAIMAKLVRVTYFVQFKIISSMLLLGLSMYFYVFLILDKTLFHTKRVAAFCAGFFFMLSPVVLGHFIGGAFNQLDSMIILMILLCCLEYFRRHPRELWVMLLIPVIFVFMEMSIHHILFGSFFILTYILFLYDYALKEKMKIFLIIAFFTGILYVHWVGPLLYGLFSENIGQRFSENIAFPNLVHNVPGIVDALFVNGYIREFYNFLVHDRVNSLWYFCSYMFLIVIFSSLFWGNRKHLIRSKIIYYWVLLFLLFLVFATGFKPPLGELVEYLYKNISAFAVFRSPQWLMNPLTIAFCVMLGIASSIIFSKWDKKSIKIVWVALICFIVHPFYLSGDLGIHSLYQRAQEGSNWYKADHLDTYKIPQDYRTSIDILAQQSNDSRVLLLPLSGSPYFLSTSYQREGAGVDPILIYKPPKSFLYSDVFPDYRGKSLITILEKMIYKDHDINFLNFIGILDVDYIMLKKDYAPLTTNYREYWNVDKIIDLLKNNIDLIGSVVIDGNSTLLVKVSDAFRLGHIYIPQKLVFYDMNLANSIQNSGVLFLDDKEIRLIQTILNTHFNVAIFPPVSNFKSIANKKVLTKNSPVIQYSKHNPCEYTVTVKNIIQSFPIVFSETYHDGWELNFGETIKGSFFGTIFNRSNKYPNDYHEIANGYANSWYVDLDYIKKNYPESITYEKNGSATLKFVISFFPQYIFNVCLFVSIVGLILVLSLIIWFWLNRNKTNHLILEKKYFQTI